MIDSQLLATARAEFSALDFTAENDRIAALEAERVRIDGAIASAEKRTRELSAEISTIIRANPGEAIADALLDNVAPTDAATAAPGRDAMIEERAKLNGGIAELRRRDTDVYHEVRAVQSAAFDKVQPTATRLADALITEARDAAGRIVSAYAALDALLGATRYGSDQCGRVGLAATRLSRQDCLLRYAPAQVDPAIVDTLRALQGKGDALPIAVREMVALPEDHAFLALATGAAAIRQVA